MVGKFFSHKGNVLDIKARDLEVIPCPVAEVRVFLETHHYSKSINGVKITQCFKVVHDRQLVGAALMGQLSTTAWKMFGETEQQVLELRRLCLLDECSRNSESRVISKCLKWVKKNIKEVKVIVSYADPMQGHSGIIYRAANFEYLGTTPNDKGYKDLETGKIYHSRALRTKYKGEYKPFVKRLREKLAKGELEPVTLLGKHRYVYRLR